MKIISILMLLSFSSAAYAQSYNCSGPKESIAKELVTLELLGMRLSDQFKCLSEWEFKTIKNRFEPPEEGYRRFDFAVKLNSLKITKLEPIDEATGQYNVFFEVTTTEEFGSQVISDKIYVILHPSKKIQELEGCGDSLAGPSKYLLAQQCYQKPKS